MYNYEIINHPNHMMIGEKCRVVNKFPNPVYSNMNSLWVELERSDMWPNLMNVYQHEIREIVMRSVSD